MPKARPIIMIHGYRGTHHGLSLIKQSLEPKFDCLVPDLPGFGAGPHLSSYSLNDYVDWLEEFVAKSTDGSTKPILLGHSFGSIVCSAYAAQYPESIAELILVNPIGAPALQGPRSMLNRLAVAYYWIGSKLPNQLASTWLSSQLVTRLMSEVMAKTRDPAKRRYIHDQHRRYFGRFHSPESVYQGFITSVSYNVRDFAKYISVPTLLIAGEKDDITTVQQQEKLLQLLPQAKLVVIPNVGHLTHYETPREVADIVQAFVKSR